MGPSASVAHIFLTQTRLSRAAPPAPHVSLLLILFTLPLFAEQTAPPWPGKEQHSRAAFGSGDWAPRGLSLEASYGVTQCGAGIACVKGFLSILSAG